MSEEFDNLNIQYAQNLNRTQKAGLQLESLAIEAGKQNNEYLDRLFNQLSPVQHEKLGIHSGEFHIGEENEGKLIFRLKHSKQFLKDVINQGYENQKAIDKLYAEIGSSSFDRKHLSSSTDVKSRKVTLNDRALLRGKILSLESDRRKIIALSRKLGEEIDTLYGELLELGKINKSLDTKHQFEPTTTLMKNKLSEALTELQQAKP
eukprot:TRINITY_DN9545_c0_g2_i1.p1 TRINITY_DN9545_c0_g2~~TRINITY_DN9545_c0_g2_i1.p1  ORF type:complete len:206 (-),score=31.13 TRINITY_DN9545_c0_g2_i1:125-742(-)